MRVGSLHVHPVKATAPVDVTESVVELSGLRHDRRWAVVDEVGDPLTAGRADVLMRVTAAPDADGGLTLAAPGVPTTYVPEPGGGAHVESGISRVPTATYAGDEAAAFFTALLGRPARLVWQHDPAGRPISPSHGGLGDEPLNLADTGPLLLATTASLDRLNEWIADEHDDDPMVMARFRPNVVVEDSPGPFVEDDWRSITIGDVPFRFAERCDRCATTLIDPATLRHGKEPIRTLARHRRWDRTTWFGIRVVPLATGTVRVGDEVQVS